MTIDRGTVSALRTAARGRRARHAGFTLIELLVVVVIIALLIALLLPAIGLAKENGRRTQCLSNIRSLAQATFMYADSNGNRLPNGNGPDMWKDYDGTSDVLVKFAEAYTTSPKAFYCPSDKDEAPTKIETAEHNAANSARISYDYYGAYWAPEYGPFMDKINKAAVWWDLQAGSSVASDMQNHGHAGGNVAYTDGHAGWLQTDQWQAANWPLEAHLNYALITP